jgi:hypothetical protein
MAAFVANPLSLSVSNEAVGAYVRESAALERRRLAEEQRRRDGAGRGGGGNGRGRGASETPHRYKTTHLTVSDLRKPPQPWRAFFASDFPRRSYALPRSADEARRRLDGNVYEFFGNYLTVAFWVVCSVLYNKPKALVGGYFCYRLWRFARALDDGSPATFAAKTRTFVATAVVWAIGLYANVSLAASYAILITTVLVTAHGCTRRRDAPAPDWGRSPRKRDSALGKLRLRE